MHKYNSIDYLKASFHKLQNLSRNAKNHIVTLCRRGMFSRIGYRVSQKCAISAVDVEFSATLYEICTHYSCGRKKN